MLKRSTRELLEDQLRKAIRPVLPGLLLLWTACVGDVGERSLDAGIPPNPDANLCASEHVERCFAIADEGTCSSDEVCVWQAGWRETSEGCYRSSGFCKFPNQDVITTMPVTILSPEGICWSMSGGVFPCGWAPGGNECPQVGALCQPSGA